MSPIFAEMAELKNAIAADAEKLDAVEKEYHTLMLSLPNLPDPDLKPGGKENNEPLRYFGDPHKFDFTPKHHVDLCTDLGLIDYERGTKLAGSGYWMYTGLGAKTGVGIAELLHRHPHQRRLRLHPAPPHAGVPVRMRPPVSSPSSLTRSTRSPTPPMTASTICCPPLRRLWHPSTGTRSSPKQICPRSCSLTPPASAGKPVPTVPTSVAWSWTPVQQGGDVPVHPSRGFRRRP